MRRVACVLIALLAAAPALAQEQNPRKLKEVSVTRVAPGEELNGRLLEISPKTVALLLDNRRVEIPLDDVQRVETRGDSLKNGAIIGAVLLGGWCAWVCGLSVPPDDIPVAVAWNAAFGALIGAGIDHAHKKRTVIYSRPEALPAGKTAALRFTIRF
jgi:hypothetical protein